MSNTLTINHVFVSTRAEAGSSIGQVSANEWNSSHAITGTLESSNIGGTILSSQITSVAASQVTGTVLSSQIATVGTSQVTVAASSLAFTSSYIQTLGSSQVTGTFGSSYITGTFGTSQITVAASSLAFTSSYIQTIGSSQMTGTLPSSQGGTGAATLGSNGNLFYNNSSAITAISGSSFNGSNQLTLTSMNLFVNGEIVNTAIDLGIYNLGGL